MGVPADVLQCIANNLTSSGFKVSQSVPLADKVTANVVGSRTRFSWKGLVIFSQHVVVRHIAQATTQNMEVLFQSGYQLGKRVNRVPLLRGMQFGYVIIPMILTEKPDADLLRRVVQSPAKHWSLFEFPVVVDLSKDKAVYFEGTPKWGALFFSDFRRIVGELTAGVLVSI